MDYFQKNQVAINACENLVCQKCSAESSRGYEYTGKLQMSNLMRKKLKVRTPAHFQYFAD